MTMCQGRIVIKAKKKKKKIIVIYEGIKRASNFGEGNLE